MADWRYRKTIQRGKKRICCNFCEERVMPNRYIGHLKADHPDCYTVTRCVWCDAFPWKRGDKTNLLHRIDCFRKKVRRDNPVWVATKTISLATDLYCNNSEIDQWDPQEYQNDPSTHEIIHHNFKKSLDKEDTRLDPVFDTDKTNIFTHWITEYDDWLIDHAGVRFSAWNSFMSFYKENENKLEFSPYWCLCEGGNEMHRHMIMRYKAEDEKDVLDDWKDIKFDFDDGRSVRAKFRKRITSKMHLINTILYQSTPQSQCLEKVKSFETMNDFFAQNAWKQCHKNGLCHFWCHKPLSRLFVYNFVQRGKGILEKFMESKIWTKFYSLDEAVRDPAQNNQWCVKMGSVVEDVRDVVLPLWPDLELEPCEEVQCHLYLGSCPYRVVKNDQLEGLCTKERNQHHLNKGHALLNIVCDNLVRIGNNGQKMLNEMDIFRKKKEDECTKMVNEKEKYFYGLLKERDGFLKDKDDLHKKLLNEKDDACNRMLEERNRLLELYNKVLKEKRLHVVIADE